MKKNLILSILALLIITVMAGTYLYREYNRRSQSVSEISPAYSLNAEQLISAFSKDSASANAKYIGKIISVTGLVKAVDKDAAGGYTISLGDAKALSSVRCSMTGDTSTAKTVTGSSLVIKGICTGFMPDDMGIGADVILNRSVISQ